MHLGNPEQSACLPARALCRLTTVTVQEENFDEAMSNAHKLFSPPSMRAPRFLRQPHCDLLLLAPRFVAERAAQVAGLPGCLLVTHADEGMPAGNHAP